MALQGEMGYPSALTAKTWGFQDVLFQGKPVTLQQPLGSYVMENVLFKISFPAEFHAQTAVEAAITLHPKVKDRLDDIERVVIETQEAGARIIDKSGPLANPADRDHCIIFGRLTADDYEDTVAADSRIDQLRNKMTVQENKQFSVDYLDPEKRAIGNAVEVFFKDGTSSGRVAVDYPIGHRRRRKDGIPLLVEKFRRNLETRFPAEKVEDMVAACEDQAVIENMPVDRFMTQWVA
jgi:2-methylcitrate dehydratase